MNRYSPERKLPWDLAHVFAWRSRDGYPSAAPTLSVEWPSSMGGTKTYVMSPVRAADTIAGYDHDNARLSLTVSGAMAGALRGVIAEYGGEAWVDGGPDYQGPVRLLELVSDGPPTAVVQLASPLPRTVDVDGTWTLRYVTYTCTIPQVDVGAARVRNVKWTLPWERRTGTDAPALQMRARGFLHVCETPFDTELSDEDLLAYVPGWGRLVPDRQSSWAEQRWAAADELMTRLRPRLDGKAEDDLLASQFRRAHALLTAAIIRRGQASLGYEGAAEDAETLAELATEALEQAFACLTWLDSDLDSTVDEGETGTAKRGVSAFAYSTASDEDADEVEDRRTTPWDDR